MEGDDEEVVFLGTEKAQAAPSNVHSRPHSPPAPSAAPARPPSQTVKTESQSAASATNPETPRPSAFSSAETSSSQIQQVDIRDLLLVHTNLMHLISQIPRSAQEVTDAETLIKKSGEWRDAHSFCEACETLVPSSTVFAKSDFEQAIKMISTARAQMALEDDDDHDSICDVCEDGGTLFLCENCPRAYHLQCLESEYILEDMEEGPFICPYCLTHRFIDDSQDLNGKDVEFAISSFDSIKTARIETIKARPEDEASTTQSEGRTTVALKRLVLARDPQFEEIDTFLSHQNKFSSRLAHAESQLIAKFAKLEEEEKEKKNVV